MKDYSFIEDCGSSSSYTYCTTVNILPQLHILQDRECSTTVTHTVGPWMFHQLHLLQDRECSTSYTHCRTANVPPQLHTLQDRDSSPTVTPIAGPCKFTRVTHTAGPWQFPHSYLCCRRVEIPLTVPYSAVFIQSLQSYTSWKDVAPPPPPPVTQVACLRGFDFAGCNWSFSNSTASVEKMDRFYISHFPAVISRVACAIYRRSWPGHAECVKILFSDIPTRWIHDEFLVFQMNFPLVSYT
jgi:hypothetical protein